MNEEIIINGVNVAGCEFAKLPIMKRPKNLVEKLFGKNEVIKNVSVSCGIKDLEGDFLNYCGRNKNCYYKQLQHLEQENKELESQRDEARIAYNNLILDIVSDIPFEGEIGGERFISIKDRLHQMQKALASLEEIREIVTSAFAKQRPYKEDFAEIETKINEVLNLS